MADGPSRAQVADRSSSSRIAVLGAGSWGTALANHLAVGGHNVLLWARSDEIARQINTSHHNNQYLPGVKLNSSLRCTADFTHATESATDLLISVPSSSFQSLVSRITSIRQDQFGLIWACKGLDPESGGFLSDFLADNLPPGNSYAIVSGPTFALELAAGLPTAITAAANELRYARKVADIFHSERLRVYTSEDINGVQFGGALKNVYAIAAGISDGLGFGANARVALITRGLAELTRMGETVGVARETLMGLAGVGDLILTCTDDQSRNRRFGLAVAKGLSVEDARLQVGQAVEGIAATRAAYQLSRNMKVEMPIVEQLYEVIAKGKAPELAVQALLARQQRDENG